jgi:hypothetical protein
MIPYTSENVRMTQERITKWKSKILHGDKPTTLKQQMSIKWHQTHGSWLVNSSQKEQVSSTNNYMIHSLKNPDITKHIHRKCLEKTESIQHISDACHVLAYGHYTHHHIEVPNAVHQELAIERGLRKGPPIR